jgi:hypothetical protein
MVVENDKEYQLYLFGQVIAGTKATTTKTGS